MTALINGHIAATKRDDGLDVFDRGPAYGDGVFETVSVIDGHCQCLDAHLRRLEQGCRRLAIKPPQPSVLRHDIARICAGKDTMVMKIIITRGKGGRGYQPPAAPNPTRLVLRAPMPPGIGDMVEHGIAVRFCRLRLAHQPLLAGIKHCNRLEYVLARMEWQDDTFREGILFDGEDHAIEAISANVFFIFGGVLVTPILDRCGVAGIMRQMVIDEAAKCSLPTACRRVTRRDVMQCKEMFITNSLLTIVPVTRCRDRSLPIGATTKMLQKRIWEKLGRVFQR